MLRMILKWTALVFLVVESLGLIASLLDLALKISQANPVSIGPVVLEATLRFAIVGLILSAYLRLRSASRLPARPATESALLTTRAAHSALLATVALLALADARISPIAETMPPLSLWGLSACALGDVCVGLFLRKQFLSSANRELRRTPYDANALRQWQKFTMVSMVLAMSIGMFGFSLRMGGYARTVEWSFFGGAVALLILWRPRLDNGMRSLEVPQENGTSQ